MPDYKGYLNILRRITPNVVDIYKKLFHVAPFQIQEMLKLVGLEKQSATFSKNLSGGQQRKLCVAMAIIGDPKVCDVVVRGMMEQTTLPKEPIMSLVEDL